MSQAGQENKRCESDWVGEMAVSLPLFFRGEAGPAGVAFPNRWRDSRYPRTRRRIDPQHGFPFLSAPLPPPSLISQKRL